MLVVSVQIVSTGIEVPTSAAMAVPVDPPDVFGTTLANCECLIMPRRYVIVAEEISAPTLPIHPADIDGDDGVLTIVGDPEGVVSHRESRSKDGDASDNSQGGYA